MQNKDKALVLLRGGGDLATGVALRLHRSGIKLVITELAQPLAVRRTVSFAEAIYEGHQTVEGVTARRVQAEGLQGWNRADEIPIVVDPDANVLTLIDFLVVVDARLMKSTPSALPVDVPLHIGLGPGFHADRDCHAVVETRRSHTLGRVYWTGSAQADSGEPEGDRRRVLRAPANGILTGHAQIGDHLEEGQLIAEVKNETEVSKIESPFKGVLRGLIHDGVEVRQGLKIGDVDPRDDPSACYLVSDKALAIGGGVLESLLSRKEIRERLWTPTAPIG
ncbi:MAG TPA: selenium-dependent molybdenum cofactor biosynthesis protein YqeB, partial [Anaerolineales bacterium]|nr:selenium-dependent molybdenum cofactor biosynthesis protein YqeB [Anaerolineales bacterium]